MFVFRKFVKAESKTLGNFELCRIEIDYNFKFICSKHVLCCMFQIILKFCLNIFTEFPLRFGKNSHQAEFIFHIDVSAALSQILFHLQIITASLRKALKF